MSARKPSEQRERRFIVEWVRTAYPDSPALFNVKVGGVPRQFQGVDIGALSPNIFKPFNRYVDSIVIRPDRLIAIEAKILADIGAVSQLEFYGKLIKETPELAAYASLPVELRIVTVSADLSFIEFAKAHGISIDIYRPPWAVEFLAKLVRAT